MLDKLFELGIITFAFVLLTQISGFLAEVLDGWISLDAVLLTYAFCIVLRAINVSYLRP